MKIKYLHKSDGIVYRILWPLTPVMHWGFFKKVYFHNREGVPGDKPVLLAVNHPTAFMDPLLLCSFLHTPIYNMTRGDLFEKPFFRKLLESANMFPVFRLRDGYSEQDRNDAVFDFCYRKMTQQQVVAVYVEGEHHLEKRVLPCQKGIARIAFGAYEKNRMDDLQIVPAGCNYVYGDRPRDVAMVNIGQPLYVRDYWEIYQKNPGRAILLLCRDIELALKELCFHIQSPEDDLLGERLLMLHRSDHPEPLLPTVKFEKRRFLAEKAVLNRMNALPADQKALLRNNTNAYAEALEAAGLEDGPLVNPAWGSPIWWILFICGFVPFLIGYASSWPLMRLSHWVADTKVKKKEFYSSVIIGVGFLAGLFYYGMLLLLCIATINPYWIAMGLTLPLLGWFAMFYRELWARWNAAQRAAKHPEKERLLALRAAIGY